MLAIQSSVPCRYNSRMSTNTSALTTIQSSGELEISCQCPASQVCLCEYWSQSALLACWVAQGMHGNAESHCCLLITSITPGDWRAPILKWLIHFNYPPCDHHILINAQSVANSFKGPITTQPSNLKSFIAQLLVKYIFPIWRTEIEVIPGKKKTSYNMTHSGYRRATIHSSVFIS